MSKFDPAIPDVLVTGGGVAGIAPRLRVDVGQTGFFAKREFRTFREFSALAGTHIPTSQRMLFRVVIPVNIILISLTVISDNGFSRTTTHVGGTPTGAFVQTPPIFPANTMTEGPAPVAPVVVITNTAAGLAAAVDITGSTLLDVLRLKIENATGAAATVGTFQDSERGVAPGTYYILVENIGSGDFEGVLKARWEQRA